MIRSALVMMMATLVLASIWPLRADGQKGADRATDGIGGDGFFRLQMVDGRSVDASLEEIKAGQFKGNEGGKAVLIPLEDILRLTAVVGESTSTKSPVGHHVFYLPDGGTFLGELAAETASGPATVKAQIGLPQPVDVKYSALVGLRVSTIDLPDVEKSFQERMADRKTGRDTMILVKDGKPIVLQGSLEKLTGTGWEFSFGNKTKTGDLANVYGFVFGAPPVPALAAEAMLQLLDGNRFGGRILHADKESLSIESSFGGAIDVPWNLIRVIDFQSARVVYLSDLKPAKAEQRSMPGAMWPARMNLSVTGGPLRLSGRTFGKGVGVHGYSSLTYELGGGFERFSAVVGVDDSVGMTGSVVFRVHGDGKKLYESRLMRGGDAPESMTVDLTGVASATLECDTADELDLSDHANWVNAILIRAKGAAK